MTDDVKHRSKSLIYSCSGCSSAAQMANALAVQADRKNLAEMSCIAGVGGDVINLVRLAKSGRPILALDGCPLSCTKSCLARQGVIPNVHLILTQLGVRKVQHSDFDPAQAEELFETVKKHLLELEDTPISGRDPETA